MTFPTVPKWCYCLPKLLIHTCLQSLTPAQSFHSAFLLLFFFIPLCCVCLLFTGKAVLPLEEFVLLRPSRSNPSRIYPQYFPGFGFPAWFFFFMLPSSAILSNGFSSFLMCLAEDFPAHWILAWSCRIFIVLPTFPLSVYFNRYFLLYPLGSSIFLIDVSYPGNDQSRQNPQNFVSGPKDSLEDAIQRMPPLAYPPKLPSQYVSPSLLNTKSRSPSRMIVCKFPLLDRIQSFTSVGLWFFLRTPPPHKAPRSSLSFSCRPSFDIEAPFSLVYFSPDSVPSSKPISFHSLLHPTATNALVPGDPPPPRKFSLLSRGNFPQTAIRFLHTGKWALPSPPPSVASPFLPIAFFTPCDV